MFSHENLRFEVKPRFCSPWAATTWKVPKCHPPGVGMAPAGRGRQRRAPEPRGLPGWVPGRCHQLWGYHSLLTQGKKDISMGIEPIDLDPKMEVRQCTIVLATFWIWNLGLSRASIFLVGTSNQSIPGLWIQENKWLSGIMDLPKKWISPSYCYVIKNQGNGHKGLVFTRGKTMAQLTDYHWALPHTIQTRHSTPVQSL